MTGNRNDKELEALVEAFVKDADTPPPSGRLRDYGLQRIIARAEASAGRERLPKRRILRNPSFVQRIVLIGLAIPLLLIVMTSSAYAFSSGSQPGSLLYGTKLFFEHARETLTISSENDIKLEIEYSDRRISELEKMIDPANNQGLDRWLREYQENINKVSGLLDQMPSESGDPLSQLLLGALDRQAGVINEIRVGRASPVQQIDEAYGLCNQGREQMRQRRGMSSQGADSGQGRMQGDQNSGNGSDQGSNSGPEGSGMNQDNGQHMEGSPQGTDQTPRPGVESGGHSHMGS